MAKQIKAWKCDYCNMTSLYKSSVTRHEKKSCSKNRACSICKWLSVEEVTVYNPHHGGNPGSTDYEIVCYWCNAYETELIDGRRNNCPKFEIKSKQ